MATIDEQQAQDQKTRENLQKAASTGKSVASAAKNASAGNFVGAALDLLKDENIRTIIIVSLLLLVFFVIGIAMFVGSAITGTVQSMQDTIAAEKEQEWEEHGIASDGSLLYLYGQQLLGISSPTETKYQMLGAVGSLIAHNYVYAEHNTNEHIESDGEVPQTQIGEEDYQLSINSVTDENSLIGTDGILQRQMDLIKGRVEQRSEQILFFAGGQYGINTLGVGIATSLTSLLRDPFLYRGINFAESSYTVDASVFELTDVQALKIYAAYAVQHDAVLANSNMWDLMDYCGWYATEFSQIDTSVYKDPQNPNIYNTDASGAFAETLSNISQGTELTSIYNMGSPYVPYWSGTCAPQWYYEQLAQMEAMNDAYEAKQEQLETERNRFFIRQAKIQQLEQELAEMPYFQEDEEGKIILDNFATIGSFETYGILDKIFTGGKATVSVIPYIIEDSAKPGEDALAAMGNFLRSLWDEACGPKYKTTRCGGSVYRSEENYHSYTLHNSEPGYTYYLVNTFTNLTSASLEGNGGDITFNVNPSTTYYAYRYATPGTGDTGVSQPPSEYVDSFFTFESSANNKAYELAIKSDVKYTARSVDDILYEQLGLWPGSLTDTQIGDDGREYATGFVGNELLLKSWTDTYTDPVTGEQKEVTFTRQQGYQAESYEDIVLALATAMGYDLTGLFAQDYGYGGTIVSMAQQELEYYTANGLSGGARYWNICGQAERGDPNYYPTDAPWCVAFVNACAYQCGFIDSGGWYRGGEWSYWVGGIYDALVNTGQAVGHNTADNYMPVPGDLILFGSSIGCAEPDHIGIVEYVDDTGKVHTIEGNSGNQLKRCVYDNYQVGSYAWDGVVISHYINPNYPSSFISNPAYQNIQTEVAPAATARMAGNNSVFLAGLPRFRHEVMGEVLDELATMYPELFTEALRLAYPHNLGSCRVNGLTWLIPMEYTGIASPYGDRVHPIWGDVRTHEGIDLDAAGGTPIYAARPGVVRYATYHYSFGNYVVIDHDGGYTTEYYHMMELPEVTAGETVKAGQIIGYCGTTGDSTGDHLHYEVWYNGAHQDPAIYLGLRGYDGMPVDRTEADDIIDHENLIAAWNSVVSSKSSRFTEAQMNIAAKLYVQPIAQRLTVNTGFNWTQTRLREEILWGIITTSSKGNALTSVLQSLSSGLDNSITDQELYAYLANDDFLVKTIMSSKYNLWPEDSVELQNEWINSIQLLMQTLEEKYAPAPPVEVEGGGQ